MTKAKKIENVINNLISDNAKISTMQIIKVSGLVDDETNRKAIRRALIKFVKEGLLKPSGLGRSRIYEISKSYSNQKDVQAVNTNTEAFIDIELSTKSVALLKYISQPMKMRKPVSYDQKFLDSYLPNKTFYLSDKNRHMLNNIGQVENQVRPAGTYARNILNRLLIDLSWNSSRLEGNRYTLLETTRLIEFGESAEDKDLTEAQMILNHKAAIEFVVENAQEKKIRSIDVRNIHALLSENLLGDPNSSGKIREISVGISGTSYLPIENPYTLKENFEIIVNKINKIIDPFEQSFFALIHLSYLQAFEDVNKRTARLVSNIPLIKKNLKPLSFTDVNPNAYAQAMLGVYEKNDISLILDLYIWAYTRSSQRYSAVQQALGEPNLLKMKYRTIIQQIIRQIVTEKTKGSEIVRQVKKLIAYHKVPAAEQNDLLQVIEVDITSLHEGNVARFKIRPTEFYDWKKEMKN